MSKYIEMWDIIEKYQIELDSELSSYVKCTICEKLLKDAYYGPCGCNYCKVCVINYLNNGKKYCPSCNLEELCFETNIVKDIRANRMVSESIVKCPLDSCIYNDKLINISDHIRVCDHKEVLCPFKEFGCSVIYKQNKEMTNHLLSDMYFHSQLLTQWIMNMRNEILSLFSLKMGEFQQEILNKLEQTMITKLSKFEDCEKIYKNQQVLLDDFKTDLQILKDKQISSLTTDIVQCKDRINFFKDNEEKIRKQDEEISQLKKIQDDQANELCKLRNTVESLLTIVPTTSLEKTPILWQKKTNLPDPDILNLNLVPIGQSNFIKSINKVLPTGICQVKPTASIIWKINEINEKRKKNEILLSTTSMSSHQKYEFHVILISAGCNIHFNSHICIQLVIFEGPNFGQGSWPCYASYGITVKNSFKPEEFRSFCKNGRFDRHSGQNYVVCHFPISNTGDDKILENDSIMIECKLDFLQ